VLFQPYIRDKGTEKGTDFLVESRVGGVSSNYYYLKLFERDLPSFLTTPTTRALPIRLLRSNSIPSASGGLLVAASQSWGPPAYPG
jgi:hypothetical protein